MHLVSIAEVAQKYNKTITQINYAIKQGRIRAVKVGWCWLCDLETLPEKWPPTPREKIKEGRSNKP